MPSQSPPDVGLGRPQTASSSSHLSDRNATRARRLRSHLAEAEASSDVSSDGRMSLGRRSTANSNAPPLPKLLQIFPIRLECTKGAMVLGNNTTKCILTTKFEKASGEIDATRSRPVDLYKQVFNLQFSQPVVQMMLNPDYSDSQAPAAAQHKDAASTHALPGPARIFNRDFRRQRRKLWHSLRDLVPFIQPSVDTLLPNPRDWTEDEAPAIPTEHPNAQWIGLSRYLVANQQEEQNRWDSVEYARFSTILHSPSVRVSLYWDEPGKVPATAESVPGGQQDATEDINGDLPPEWGLDLSVQGGTINYGPWADRRRAELQAAFFPRICSDAVPAQKLRPGQSRVTTVFRLFVELEADTSLRVPTREKSKDWKWRGRDGEGTRIHKRGKEKAKKKAGRRKKHDKGEPGPEMRPFGWLDVKVKADSTISYVTDMYARKSGYQTKLELDLREPECSTSVNHGLLLRSENLSLSCDLSSPLEWNTQRTWSFGVLGRRPELFLLRDHIFLLSDLIDDWGSGPPSDYYTFTPYEYLINLRFIDWRFYLNANDHNIINNPSDFDDNTFLAVYGASLVSDLVIPLDKFRASQNEIPFEVRAHDGGIELHTPLWNTQSTFLHSKGVAKLRDLAIEGRYNYYASTSSNLTDTLELDVRGSSLSVDLYGFLIRYILKLKDNYFGEDIHFRTLDEYQALRAKDANAVVAESSAEHHKQSNDLDVILSVEVEDGSILLPANLYSAKDHVRLDLARLNTDLRFTNYYMDLEVNFSPLAVSLGNIGDGDSSPASSVSGTQAFIDGVTVYGHRLFGLAPAEPTYVCNWDFTVGAITGECSTDFLNTLLSGVRNFAFTFDDDENALPDTLTQALHDVTFLRAKLAKVRVWLHVEQAAVLLCSGAINAEFDDWAGSDISARLNVLVPDLILSCVDAESASRHRSRGNSRVTTHSYFQTSVKLTMGGRKAEFSKDRQLQQHHLRYHDQRTCRTGFLLRSSGRGGNLGLHNRGSTAVNQPAMPFPPMPEPIAHNHTWSSKSSSDHSLVALLGSDAHMGLSNRATHSSGSRSIAAASVSVPSAQSAHDSPSAGRRASTRTRAPVAAPEQGVAPTSVTFSSSFIAPYFPLETVEPDVRDVPVLPSLTEDDPDEDDPDEREDNLPLERVSAGSVDEEAAHTRLVVSLDPGVKAFFKIEALHAAIEGLAKLQPTRPLDLLDTYQVTVVSKIMDLAAVRLAKGKTVDLKVNIPYTHVRFASAYSIDSRLHSRRGMDEYNICLSRLLVTARERHASRGPRNPGAAGDVRAIHARLDSVNFGVQEDLGSPSQINTAVRGDVDKIVGWLADGDTISADLQFRNLEVAMESKTIDYLAALIDRTAAQAQGLKSAWITLERARERRLQGLVFELTTHGANLQDPSFLTRPSYALRSAADHVRLTDSWKIISRLRYIYLSLPTGQREDISFRCFSGSEDVPDDAHRRVLESFDQWRSWELANVRQSCAMQTLYGAEEADSAGHARAGKVRAGMKCRAVRLLIDPGPKESEVSLQGTHVCAAIDPPDSTRAKASSNANVAVLQVHSNQVSIRLNWELCELAEQLIALQKSRMADPIPATPGSAPTGHRSPPVAGKDFHVVVDTDTATVILDAINLKSKSSSTGLKGSFVFAHRLDDSSRRVANLLLHSDAASTELMSQTRVLTASKVKIPSVHLCYDGQSELGQPLDVWKLAGSCKELSHSLEEVLMGLIEVADLVIANEVAYIQRLFGSIPATADQPPPQGPDGSRRTLNRFHVALLLDAYRLNFAVLPSLKYTICGRVARTSLVLVPDGASVFDFDLKEQSHSLETSKRATTGRSIPVLELPPVIGRVVSRSSSIETALEFIATVEGIKLDAAALHDICVTLNRPEIVSSLKDIRTEAEATQAHLRTVLAAHRKPGQNHESSPARAFIYVAHVSFAGVSVHASAPGKHSNSQIARLEFNVGGVQMKLANRVDNSGPPLEFIEVHLTLRELCFRLMRSKEGFTEPCGSLTFAANLSCSSKKNVGGTDVRTYHVQSGGLAIDLYAATASTVVDVAGHLQERIKDLDLSKEAKYLRQLRKPRHLVTLSAPGHSESTPMAGEGSAPLFDAIYSLELLNVQISWIVGHKVSTLPRRETENLVLSSRRINLATRKENAARLTIEDLQLQMVPTSQKKTERSSTSALLPEVVFNVAYLTTKHDRRLAFQAAGKKLDLRFSSQSVLAINEVQRSIATASGKFRAASASWSPGTAHGGRGKSLLSSKRLSSLLIDADFAGAVVFVQGRKVEDSLQSSLSMSPGGRVPQHGKYGQFTQDDASSSTTLRAPGVALKLEYTDNGEDDPSINAEVRVDASTNILFPTVVPLIMEISSSVKEVVSTSEDAGDQSEVTTTPQRFLDDDTILTSDPSTVLGRCKLNVGLRICRQEFSLSCQPIARVQATARFNDIYVTINTVKTTEHGHFFALSAAFTHLQASVQHVYSREVTGTFDVESIVLSLMNSKHVSGTSGISTILKVGPMKAQINARQLQDFLLFRDIWVPSEIRQAPRTQPSPTSEHHPYLVQRYQQVAAAGAFPWNAAVAVAELKVQLDLGQALGKASFLISNLWISTKKSSDWEQNLCMGFDNVRIDSEGRMSGFVGLQDFKVRTTIQWRSKLSAVNETPVVQASLGFGQLRVKAAFDYQAFLVADVTAFEFLMYNVRGDSSFEGDRLVGNLDGGKVEVFCTSTSAAQGIALYQAFIRLAQEKKAAYEANLKDIEKYLRRSSTVLAGAPSPSPEASVKKQEEKPVQGPLSLHTDVVVTLKEVNIGAFPSTFSDKQIFKLEALNAEARFAVSTKGDKIHSRLGLTLGQLHVALSIVRRPQATRSLMDVTVEDVIKSANGARGDTILQVPKVVATMQTWQMPSSNHIDYIFTSSFEGKVDIGWNYSRINFVRGMFASHSRTLAQRLGKPMPQSAVRITGGLQPDALGAEGGGQGKITAVVDVPQSKYDYTALEPPIIETPQLRELGDATPPLEWIGLHRDRLPNLTHQIVIVALLEVAREVEDAYSRILGSS
ncbi:MAG: hypothetical protein M1832_001381 [Thelocarpon impressellum]|nr:MAG: hypothetical protein M1832_001381 [Thelocarpon impressellum]